jgi:Holliday junction resolvase
VFRSVTIAALTVAGFALIALGVDSWLTHEAAAGTVVRFMNALTRGDRETVLACLSFDARATAEQRITSGTLPWTGLHDVTYRVHQTRADRGSATVEIRIERSSFVVQPLFHLVRSESGRWQIDRIERLDIDPLWFDLERERQRTAEEDLTRELTEALEREAGVDVERGPSSGFVP